MVLRDLEERDLDAVKALIHETIDASYPAFYGPGAIGHMKDHHSEENILADAREGCTLVVEHDGSIVGTGTLTGAKIRRLFVHSFHQRRGMGSWIMRALAWIFHAFGAALANGCLASRRIGN